MTTARDRILDATLALLGEGEGGADALTIRQVAARARVAAPAIYRAFGDKAGLLAAAAEAGAARYVAAKRAGRGAHDALARLRANWDNHIAFSLAHPALFAVIAGHAQPGSAAADGLAHTRELLGELAAEGRLKVPLAQAAVVIHACANGLIQMLIGAGPSDAGAAATLGPLVRDMVFARLVDEAPAEGAPGEGGGDPRARAIATLAARLPGESALSAAERALMGEWLARLDQPPTTPDRRA